MNREELLLLFGEIDDRFVMEAAETRGGMTRRFPRRRMLMLAAVIVVTVLLVGCAAVYVWLNDLPTDPRRDRAYNPQLQQLVPVEKDRKLQLFPGTPDSNIAMAVRDWMEFTDTYEVPKQYYVTRHPEVSEYMYVNYSCLTPEMADKLREIAENYHLQLGERLYSFVRWQGDAALEILGIDALTREGTQATVRDLEGHLEVPYNFDFRGTMTLQAADTQTWRRFTLRTLYRRNGYMPQDWAWSLDAKDYEQWQYVNADGVTLRMALQPEYGIMVAEQAEGYITMSVSPYSYGKPDEPIDRKLLEQIADTVNFTFTPQPVEQEVAQQLLDEAEAAFRKGRFVFDSFEDYLKTGFTPITLEEQQLDYAVHDLNGDGLPEYFIGSGGGYRLWFLQHKDGTVELDAFSPTYFCTNGCAVGENHWDDTSTYTIYTPLEREIGFEESQSFTRLGDKWYAVQYNMHPDALKNFPTLPEAEVRAVLEEYVPVEPDWKPLDTYPMSDGRTLMEYLQAQDIRIPNEQLPEIYGQYMLSGDGFGTHYRILDFNNDGIDDLLLSGDGETFSSVHTYRYSRVEQVSRIGAFWLYEGNVAGVNRATHIPPDTDLSVQEYYIADENWTWHLTNYAGYDSAKDKWYSDFLEESTKEAVDAVIAGYKLADQGMRPVEELEEYGMENR